MHIFDTLIIFGANYLIFVTVAIAFWYFLNQSRNEQKKILLFSLIVLPTAYVVSRILAHFYYDPRPFVTGHFKPLFFHIPNNGFPSDHTLLGSAIAMVIFYFGKKTGALLLALTFLVGLARVLAGVHHFIDILGSLLIVIFLSFLLYKFLFLKIIRSEFYKKRFVGPMRYS